jgi:hypothetical protein
VGQFGGVTAGAAAVKCRPPEPRRFCNSLSSRRLKRRPPIVPPPQPPPPSPHAPTSASPAPNRSKCPHPHPPGPMASALSTATFGESLCAVGRGLVLCQRALRRLWLRALGPTIVWTMHTCCAAVVGCGTITTTRSLAPPLPDAHPQQPRTQPAHSQLLACPAAVCNRRHTSPGFPRIGARREMKTALEKHWAGKLTQAELLEVAHATQAHVSCGWRVVGLAAAARSAHAPPLTQHHGTYTHAHTPRTSPRRTGSSRLTPALSASASTAPCTTRWVRGGVKLRTVGVRVCACVCGWWWWW